ncbi:hypothetical protein BSO21_16255 [Paenibacillus odorifer]|uniref:Cytidylate kinase n=1 Tax=Paenibacillus odorifer TaxID=189426 RepID=A0ABX3GLX0_9BACL|nr:hypothetical protein BSO21_16255 [Paenibacillus odorifer]
MNDLDKRINILLQLIFIAAIILTLWNGMEGANLNQRYESSVKQHELTTADYIKYLERSKQQIQELIDEKG